MSYYLIFILALQGEPIAIQFHSYADCSAASIKVQVAYKDATSYCFSNKST